MSRESDENSPSWRTSASLQGLVQVKYAVAVDRGQQFLRGEAFEFAATVICMYILLLLCLCYNKLRVKEVTQEQCITGNFPEASTSHSHKSSHGVLLIKVAGVNI